MPTRVTAIEISQIPEKIYKLSNYDHLLCLFRSGRTPLAQIVLPVTGDVIEGSIIETYARDACARLAEAGNLSFPWSPPEKTEVSRNQVTVAICTRERPDDLRRCLDALSNQKGGTPDVMVVDNFPATGSTKSVAAEYSFVRYVLEPRKGLNNARNRAFDEAQSEIVAFIDDDAVADPDWLDAISCPFENPRVACVTGLTMPLELETPAQELFERVTGFSRRGLLRRTFESPQTPPLAAGQVGAGANMAIRRSIRERIGPFDPALDAGTVTCSGGDHEFFTRILRSGQIIVYEPEALNWHRHRRTHEETLDAIRGYGVGVYAAWTASLVNAGDVNVFRIAMGWLVHEQLPNLLRGVFYRDPPVPLEIVAAELSGCIRGPFAYLKSRKSARG